MPTTKTGKIRTDSLADGTRVLILWKPNPSPPPPELEWTLTNPLAWIWEKVEGNVGQECLIELDDAGVVTRCRVG